MHVFCARVSALSGAGTALGVVVSEIVRRDASNGLRAEGTMCLMPACVKADAVVGVVGVETPVAGGVIAAGAMSNLRRQSIVWRVFRQLCKGDGSIVNEDTSEMICEEWINQQTNKSPQTYIHNTEPP